MEGDLKLVIDIVIGTILLPWRIQKIIKDIQALALDFEEI